MTDFLIAQHQHRLAMAYCDLADRARLHGMSGIALLWQREALREEVAAIHACPPNSPSHAILVESARASAVSAGEDLLRLRRYRVVDAVVVRGRGLVVVVEGDGTDGEWPDKGMARYRDVSGQWLNLRVRTVEGFTTGRTHGLVLHYKPDITTSTFVPGSMLEAIGSGYTCGAMSMQRERIRRKDCAP